ncbi:hypothetical protein CMI48_03980 [Candidatus Pacearchaeota archaeon]|jgi:hypothetical protein|nr:hypothetical protein [Candidatus Pacearchaeota archaeon]
MVLLKKEEQILQSIVVPSENNPNKPEFPPEQPHWPSTPTVRIKVPGFTNVWLKDESKNPTGTHKDRMAWELVVTYRDFLLALKSGKVKGKLPQLSIISSGSAAVAIQTMLKQYGLPNLKVLVDSSLDESVKEVLKKLGCELYEAELSRQALEWKEILALTDNPEGFDITSSEALDPTTRFYDWMSYDVINKNAEYVFVPFGTGNLYENILNVAKKEVNAEKHDPRFRGDVEVLRKCNFIGATTNNPKSKADKLFSPHLPFVHYDEQWIGFYRAAGYCGPESNVYPLQEKFLDQALELAESQGIDCEPSGIAGLALLLQMADRVPKDAKILIVNTGKTKY